MKFCLLFALFFVVRINVVINEAVSIEGILAAFADLNYDKRTDVVTIREFGKSFQIYLQTTLSPYFQPSLRCYIYNINDERIVSIVPGDFSGNTMLELIVVSRVIKSSSRYNLRILRTNKSSRPNCTTFRESLFATVLTEPMQLDFNGDMISDLLAIDTNYERSLWLGTKNGTFEKMKFPSTNNNYLKIPHSNAFVDLNDDSVADIFLEEDDHMEYWLAGPSGYSQSYNINISYPDPTRYKVIGQSTFIDLNGDAKIDHLVPVCLEIEKNCSILGYNKDKKQWETLGTDFKLLTNETESGLVFTSKKLPYLIELPITLRSGDFNGDGFFDLIAVMKETISSLNHVIIFENNPGNSNSFGRVFEPMANANQPQLTNSAIQPLITSFFDVKEDGKLDVLTSYGSNDAPIKDLKVEVNFKTEYVDTNFLKVLVTTSQCPQTSCYDDDFLKRNSYQVMHSTSQSGPFVSYSFIDSMGDEKKLCAGQLSQSSHFSLQLPYLLFGLGSYANFIDEIMVTVPTGNTSLILQTKYEEGIVPNAQIIIIPTPLNEPKRWLMRLFLKPSEIIFQTLYTLFGICSFILIIIGFMHRKEVKEDLKEQQEYKKNWVDSRN